MPVIAGIDIGSNAMRLVIGNVDHCQRLNVIECSREPVRLGHDTFTIGAISERSIGLAIDTLSRFRKSMERYGVVWSRVVATSAIREAANRESFVEKVNKSLGMKIVVIGAEEEARLIHLAVSDKIDTQKKRVLLIDIGGGSVEITLVNDGQIVSTESLAIGTVRLMCLLKDKSRDEQEFNQLVHEYVRSMRNHLLTVFGAPKIDVCVGTGGNLESLGDLRKNLLGKENNTVISAEEINTLVKKLRNTTYEERTKEMGLRPDRADVIVPASIVLQRIVKLAGVSEVSVPGVGVKEGILLDIGSDLYGNKNNFHAEQVLTGAKQLGRKYAFDEKHSMTVARFAVKLFDVTLDLHNLDGESRLLLEAAALLHDIGHFVNISKHHKHSYYLLTSTPLLGLNDRQMAVVANVARYHRMAFPSLKHTGYAELSPPDREITSKLSGLLRVADAMDTEHEERVSDFSLERSKSKCILHLRGEGDLLIEKWKLAKKATLFEEVFNTRLVIE